MKQTKANRERALAALEAVRAFSMTPMGEEITSPALLRQNIADLIANVGHLCDKENFSLPSIYQSAAMHYQAETRNTGFQFDDDLKGIHVVEESDGV